MKPGPYNTPANDCDSAQVKIMLVNFGGFTSYILLCKPTSLHDNPHKPGHFRVKYFTKRAKMAGENDMLQLIACFSLCGELSL